MPTVAAKKKPAARRSVAAAAKKPAKPKTFGEWAKRVSGMADSGKGNLSTREGFGD